MGKQKPPKRGKANKRKNLDFEEEFKIAVGEMNMNPHEFWALTYAEFMEMVDGYQRRKEQQLDELIYLAWHIAALNRYPGNKKLPSLKSLLKKSKGKNEQTAEEMMAMAKSLTLAFGGDIKIVKG